MCLVQELPPALGWPMENQNQQTHWLQERRPGGVAHLPLPYAAAVALGSLQHLDCHTSDSVSY